MTADAKKRDYPQRKWLTTERQQNYIHVLLSVLGYPQSFTPPKSVFNTPTRGSAGKVIGYLERIARSRGIRFATKEGRRITFVRIPDPYADNELPPPEYEI